MEDLYANSNSAGKQISGVTHKLSIDKRKNCRLTGVLEICSFDDGEVIMETDAGMLTLKGNGFHITRLDLEKGEADVEGKVDILQYADKTSITKKGESLIARLFG